MKTSIPIRIYLVDLYANGLEPEIGETIYRTKSTVRSESTSGLFGSHTTHSVASKEEIYGKFYGNPTVNPGKYGQHAVEPILKAYDCPNQYYNNLFLEKKNGHGLWAHNCYILRNVELL